MRCDNPFLLPLLALVAGPALALADGSEFVLHTAPIVIGRAVLKITAPEGAAVEIFEGDRRVYEDTVPCSFDAKGDQDYRVFVRQGERAWERKISAKPSEVTTLAVNFDAPMPLRPDPISDADFKALVASIERTRIYKNKVELVRKAAQKDWFMSAQVGRILDFTTLSLDRMEMLRVLRTRIVDPENAFKIYGYLRLDGEKRRAKQILEPAGPPLAPR